MKQSGNISVLMSVYNDSETLEEAIDSILNQTYRNYEFLIVNDGSTNQKVGEILDGYSDPRIKVFNFEENKGLTYALNFLLQEASFDLVARMDADDIARPERFDRQVDFLNKNPQVDILCTAIQKFGGSDGEWVVENDDKVIKSILVFGGSSIPHPTVMMRKSSLDKAGLKYREVQYAEDYDLWVNCALKGLVFGSIEDHLLDYRVPYNKNTFKVETQRHASSLIAIDFIKKAFNVCLTEDEYKSLFKNKCDSFSKVIIWYKKLNELIEGCPVYLSRRLVVHQAILQLDIYNGFDGRFFLFFMKKVLSSVMFRKVAYDN